MLQHLGHLYTTCPGFSCKLSMNSLVAFPLGTAPCEEEDGCQGRATAPSVLTAHSGQTFENCDYTHGMGVQDRPGGGIMCKLKRGTKGQRYELGRGQVLKVYTTGAQVCA